MQTAKKIALKIAQLFLRGWKMLAMFIGSSMMVLTILMLVVVIVVSLAVEDRVDGSLSRTEIYSGAEQEIAVVRLTGEITSTAEDSIWGFNPFAINPRQVQRLASKLSQLEKVKAVLFVINSPGGSVAASEEIYQLISLLNEIKPVYTYLEEMGTSGAYYIALPSRKIYASIPTITGSIGVIAYDADLSGLMENVGVKLDTYQSGPLKDLGSFTRSGTRQEREIFESIIQDSYSLFTSRILEHRNLTQEKVLELADGRIYSGKQAQANGLIDELASFTESLALVAKEVSIENPTVVEYQLESSFWSGFLGSSVQKVLPTALFPDRLLHSRTGLYYF